MNNEQKKSLDFIRSFGNNYNVTVLEGVAGSGKTLVYFERIKDIINKGFQALILLPEIALTNQFSRRFKEFFGTNPAIWHSAATKKNKSIIWKGITEGEIKIVIGARSSLFLPFKNLGIIIVDEEHDPSYKQDEGVSYNARDMAIARASLENIPINFTLGFSVRQNYLAARLSNPDFVNVFLGRLNQVVIAHEAGSGDQVGEKVTLSTQNALIRAREKYKDVQSKLIGASIRNGEQVAFLAGLDVLTIPPKAIKEFQESGKAANEVMSRLNEEIVPGINNSHPLAKRFPCLWEMPDQFISFVDVLMKENRLDEMQNSLLG